MAKLKIKFHPVFIIFIILLIFSKNLLSVVSYLLCVFLHEMGHYFVAGFLGYKLNKINFLPFGASLSGSENVFYKPSHEILISIAGPFVNFILLIICLSLFWCFPVSYCFLLDFFYANLITLLFNFLPVYPLDGGRVLLALIKRKKTIDKAYKQVKIIGFIVSLLLFVLFVISSFFKINFTLATTSIFLIAGLFFEDKSCYYVTNYSFINKSKKLKAGLETNIISISSEANLYSLLRKLNKFKFNVVNIIDQRGKIIKNLSEQEVNNLFIKYPLTFYIKDTIK
ncbi:MAG: hypothetical protein E7359_03890 [Clostridiales bacterium]|nr:hypothetical protein [Clostridiales bacterium]